LVLRRQTAEGPAVPLSDASVRDRRLDDGCEIEEPKRVGDRRAGPAHPFGDRFVGQPEVVDQSAETVR
jgi:hypothetical protein